MSDCNYIDAFEKAVSIDDFSASKGRGDAEKLFGQGHVVFLGGYMETGPITNILYDEPNNIYNDNLEKILLKYGIDKVKKVYLTSKLNKIKSYGFLQSDDGLVGGTQVETGCYNDTVRQYAFNFNKTMFDLSSKNLEK